MSLTQAGDHPRPCHIDVHGHRGARAILPENTMPAFQYAVQQGVQYLELDLGVTSDRKVIISHERFLSGELCKGPGTDLERPWIQLSLEQVKRYDCGSKKKGGNPQELRPGTPIPTLDELFTWIEQASLTQPHAKEVKFNIETKILESAPKETVSPEEFIALVHEVVVRHHMQNRTIIQSFDFRTLKVSKKLRPEIAVSALVKDSFIDWNQLVETFENKNGFHLEYISPSFEVLNRGSRQQAQERIQQMHAKKVQVVPWTLNSPQEWNTALDLSVDGIISDNPHALQEHLAKRCGSK